MRDKALDYWVKRYERRQGSSVYSDITNHRARIWECIEEVTNGLNAYSVTDVGCGDLGFWRGHTLPGEYNGVDWVPELVKRNASRWPNKRWYLQDASSLPIPTAQIVLCIDVIFHIMDDWRAELLMDQCAAAAHQWFFVVGHHANPFEGMTEQQEARLSTYLSYRKMPTRLHNFKLVRCEITSGTVALSVFRRINYEPA